MDHRPVFGDDFCQTKAELDIGLSKRRINRRISVSEGALRQEVGVVDKQQAALATTAALGDECYDGSLTTPTPIPPLNMRERWTERAPYGVQSKQAFLICSFQA